VLRRNRAGFEERGGGVRRDPAESGCGGEWGNGCCRGTKTNVLVDGEKGLEKIFLRLQDQSQVFLPPDRHGCRSVIRDRFDHIVGRLS